MAAESELNRTRSQNMAMTLCPSFFTMLRIRRTSSLSPDDDSTCIVISHGSQQTVNHTNARQLNDLLKRRGCKPKQPVKLDEHSRAERGDHAGHRFRLALTPQGVADTERG